MSDVPVLSQFLTIRRGKCSNKMHCRKVGCVCGAVMCVWHVMYMLCLHQVCVHMYTRVVEAVFPNQSHFGGQGVGREQSLSLNPKLPDDQLGWLARSCGDPPVCSTTEVTGCAECAPLLTQLLGLNSGPRPCTEGTLLTGSSPQPPEKCFD